MKAKYFIVIVGLFSFLAILTTSSFAQSTGGSQSCVVTQKPGSNLLIVSCPDGSRTVDAGGRSDLYRVGDRIDVYGLPGNRPSTLPGQTQTPR